MKTMIFWFKRHKIVILSIFFALLVFGLSQMNTFVVQEDDSQERAEEAVNNNQTPTREETVSPQKTVTQDDSTLSQKEEKLVQKSPNKGSSEGEGALPETYLLPVPFMVQAPFGNWDMPYQESCEEASLIMASEYLLGTVRISSQDAENKLKKLVAWEQEFFGTYHDTDTEQTAEMARRYFQLQATISETVTVRAIKQALYSGQLVVLPTAGRLLHNPHFRGEGPLYHMLVVRGWDESKKKFVVNDPGTRFGEAYQYSYSVLLNAVHDWNGGKINEGRKMMILLSPE